MNNFNNSLSIPTRELANSYKDLNTSHIIHDYKNLHQDSTREFYYIHKENLIDLNKFYLACHKIALKEYEFNSDFLSTFRKDKDIDYTEDEIEEIFQDDMEADEHRVFHLTTNDDLFKMIGYSEPDFKNKFYSVFDKKDKELIIYQFEHKEKRFDDYIIFNKNYIGYISKFSWY